MHKEICKYRDTHVCLSTKIQRYTQIHIQRKRRTETETDNMHKDYKKEKKEHTQTHTLTTNYTDKEMKSKEWEREGIT